MLHTRSTRDGHQSKKEDSILDTVLESVNCAPKMLGYQLIIYTFMDPSSVLVCELYKSMIIASSFRAKACKKRSHEVRSTNSAHPAEV